MRQLQNHKAMGTTTEILKIESESLKDNYLGDPSTREIII